MSEHRNYERILRDHFMGKNCANPSCFAYPMRGAPLCASCSTKRDCLFLLGVLAGGVAIFAACMRFC